MPAIYGLKQPARTVLAEGELPHGFCRNHLRRADPIDRGRGDLDANSGRKEAQNPDARSAYCEPSDSTRPDCLAKPNVGVEGASGCGEWGRQGRRSAWPRRPCRRSRRRFANGRLSVRAGRVQEASPRQERDRAVHFSRQYPLSKKYPFGRQTSLFWRSALTIGVPHVTSAASVCDVRSVKRQGVAPDCQLRRPG